jgi:hypothetical protein
MFDRARALGIVGALLAIGTAGATRAQEAPGGGAGPPVESSPIDSSIRVGPLELDVHLSRTAQVFHVVDQLSAWSPYCHAQYAAAIKLSDADRSLLVRHAAVRRRFGWGGLEKAFYVTDDLDAAIARAVEARVLSPDDGEVERAVLTAFAPRLDEAIDKGRPGLVAFARRIVQEAPRLGETSRRLAALCEVAEVVPVPVYLIWNPSDSDIGGGFNGGRLTLEVPSRRDAMPIFLHEAFHALLNTRADTIRKAAQSGAGLDEETLQEGIAYALAPGLIHDPGIGGDPLAERVRKDREAGRTLDDPYVRFHRLASEIRPHLKRALDGGVSFDAFLASAVEAWGRIKDGR